MARAQMPMTALEATIGVLLLASVTFSFALGTPAAGTAETQLDTYASDAATILANEPPRHAEQSRLQEVVSSKSSFEREKDALRRRVGRILPANLMFRIETEYGTVGHSLPDDVPTGTATIPTTDGDVTLRVWYV
jgi:hypothetical protein